MASEQIEFDNGRGHRLSGRIDRPDGTPRGWAVFAHCFTCGKDLRAARAVALALCESGWAVLRFDFTGIGQSEGAFVDKTFAANVDDLVAAADWLRRNEAAPRLLVGHSWGGTAAIAAGVRVPEVSEVATIGAPADPADVTRHFAAELDRIEAEGSAEVTLAGRPFRVGRDLVADVRTHKLERILNEGGPALLILHSPQDELVSIDNATRLFKHARHPKSFVSLDGADHLLSDPGDADWVGHLIAAWASRRVDRHDREAAQTSDHGTVRVALRDEGYACDVVAGAHRIVADEPEKVGGRDTGMTPYDLLLGSLGTCTAMTLRMYANRKKWPLDGVTVRLRHDSDHGGDAEHLDRGDYHIERIVEIEGALDADQRKRLMEIADRCPVHRTLHGEIFVETKAQ